MSDVNVRMWNSDKRDLRPTTADSRKARVCHVVATTEGATWLLEQLRELRDQHGFEVAAVVSGTQGKLIDKLRAENIPFHVANFAAGSGSPREILRMPLAIVQLARIFRRERFDVVQTHVFTSMFISRPAAWLADVPVRLAMLAGPFHLEAHTSRWIDRVTCWMETQLIPACEKSVRLCRELGIPKKQIAPIIYYTANEQNFNPQNIPPANIRSEYGWPEDSQLISKVAYFYPALPVCGWVPPEVAGRAVKGHEDLVKSAPTVLSEFPKAKFLLVGSGWGEAGENYLENVRQLVRSMGLEDSVIFPGFRADANAILRESDVAVQASLSENLGGVIEALMLECPVVATRVGGIPDGVRDGQTGVLVNPADPDDMARGIIQMLRDPQRARALGRAGRELMLSRFTLNRTVNDLAELYAGLILREKSRGKFYRLTVSLCRAVLGVPVFTYFIFRLFFVDMFLPIYLPSYRARIRAVPVRFYWFMRLTLNRLYVGIRFRRIL